MDVDISIIVGGEAGQGIQTVGHLMAGICRNAGLHVFAINDFESRIRGGHNFFQIRISNKMIRAPHHQIHALICMDRRTYDTHNGQVDADGVIIADPKLELSDARVINVDFNDIAKTAGNKATANTVAASACLSVIGAPVDVIEEGVAHFFKTKPTDIIAKNKHAAQLGHHTAKDRAFKRRFEWRFPKAPAGLIDGSHAIALGALAGDCRFASFYPMSPATDIMQHLTRLAHEFPLIVEQAEDEIAAINMGIGASFAGARSLTATSGGGFCLMTEGIGLSGMTETPIVVIDAMRPGPATGLPTRTAQSDLLFIIHASQDEFPRFVFAPSSPEDAYAITAKAMNLADRYQVPIIILADHFLVTSLFSLESKFSAPTSVTHYSITDDALDDPNTYKRYALTDDGISPRAIPCEGKALVIAAGNEHREDGHISEEISDRNNMVAKRNAKLHAMLSEINPPSVHYPESETFLVGWGSTRDIIAESITMLRREGIDIGSIHFTDLWPFPAEEVAHILSSKPFYMVEQNATAQCGQLIKAQTGLSAADSLLKYDGRSFLPVEICHAFKAKSEGETINND